MAKLLRRGACLVAVYLVLLACTAHLCRASSRTLSAPAPWPALGDRVAINFYGSMEAFPHTKTSIYNKLIKPLEAFNLKVDVFLHTYHVSDAATQSIINTLKPVEHEIVAKDEAIARFKYEIEGCASTPSPHALDAASRAAVVREAHEYFGRMVSLNRVRRLWGKYKKELKYLTVIYARLDTVFLCPFPTSWMFLHKTRFNVPTDGSLAYLPNFRSGLGLNDDFIVTDPYTADLIGDRLHYSIGVCGAEYIDSKAHMESFAKTMQMATMRIPTFPFNRVNAAGDTVEHEAIDLTCAAAPREAAVAGQAPAPAATKAA